MAEFKINKQYAQKYNKFKEKEELQMLKDKYGDIGNSESSSSSESEDEDAEELNPKLEKNWLRTLSALKRKDPHIYDKDFEFYDIDQSRTQRQIGKKAKPMYLKDYDRKVILEKDGTISSEDEHEIPRGKSRNYYEEQEEIRKSFHVGMLSSDEDENNDLLQKRQKTSETVAKEDEEYFEWLKGVKDKLDNDDKVGIELKPLKEYWEDPKLDEGEKFLRDYILNKRYKETDDEIPTYSEIVGDKEDYSDEEELLQKQDDFERKYNFRYEEPDQEFIKSYPRVIDDSLRKKETKRADRRQEIKERKKKDKQKKKEEIKQLKNLKKREIKAKLEKLKEITGNQTLGISEEDLNDDFDPEKHDDMMQKYFDTQYYDEDEGDQKPVFSDEELETENWDNWTGAKESDQYDDDWSGEVEAEDPNFVMDCDYDPDAALERRKQKKQKKSKFSQALNKSKPVYDPNEKTFEEYFDEYYKLDYEDVIGDMPTRFRYRKVASNDFGLSVNEILSCKDKELNAWVSLKKMTQYRTKEEEEADQNIFRKKGKNVQKKLNVLHSLVEDKEKEEVDKKQGNQGQSSKGNLSSASSKKKKKRKKKSDDNTDALEDFAKMKEDGKDAMNNSPEKSKKDEVTNDNFTQGGNQMVKSSGKQTKKKQQKVSNQEPSDKNGLGKRKDGGIKKKKQRKLVMSDERLKAYGINPKKYKYMKIKKHEDILNQ